MAGKSDSLTRKTRTNLDFYHSPTQLRFDTWHRLEEYTSRLKKHQKYNSDSALLLRKAEDAISLLQTIEN